MSDPKGQPIGNVFDQNKPVSSNQKSLFSFLPVLKSVHDLLMRYGNHRADLYPDHIRIPIENEIKIWSENEANMLSLPQDVRLMIDQMAENNVKPLFKK